MSHCVDDAHGHCYFVDDAGHVDYVDDVGTADVVVVVMV